MGPASGERAAKSKLTGDQVRAIRIQYLRDGSTALLYKTGEVYGVSDDAIREILRGTSYEEIAAEDGFPNRAFDEWQDDKKARGIAKRARLAERAANSSKTRAKNADWDEIERRALAGESYPSLSKAFGVSGATISRHLEKRRGGKTSDALHQRANGAKPDVAFGVVWESDAQLSRVFKISTVTICARRKRGWPIEKILLTPPDARHGRKSAATESGAVEWPPEAKDGFLRCPEIRAGLDYSASSPSSSTEPNLAARGERP